MTSTADVVALDRERQKRSEATEAALTTAGGMLMAAREAMGLSPDDIAERTRIKLSVIEAIEAMDAGKLPSQPYTMGFVRAYAREVHLPEDALMERFRQQIGWSAPETAPKVKVASGSGERSDGSRELSVLALIAILAGIFFIAWKLLVAASPEAPSDATRFTFSKDDQGDRVTDRTVAEAADGPIVLEMATPDMAEPASDEALAAAGDDTAPETDEVVSATDEVTGSRSEAAPQTPAQQPAEALATAQQPAAREPRPQPEPEPVVAEPLPQPEPMVLRRLSAIDPDYPPLCESAAAETESVTVRYRVDTGGFVTSPQVASSTNPCFNGSAIAAIIRWRYDPDSVTPANGRGLAATFTFERPF